MCYDVYKFIGLDISLCILDSCYCVLMRDFLYRPGFVVHIPLSQ